MNRIFLLSSVSPALVVRLSCLWDFSMISRCFFSRTNGAAETDSEIICKNNAKTISKVNVLTNKLKILIIKGPYVPTTVLFFDVALSH